MCVCVCVCRGQASLCVEGSIHLDACHFHDWHMTAPITEQRDLNEKCQGDRQVFIISKIIHSNAHICLDVPAVMDYIFIH